MKRLQEAQKEIQQHNSTPPDRTDQSKNLFMQWRMDRVFREDMQLYAQVYKQEFMEVRRLLVVKDPDAVKRVEDYENPGNMGGVTGICFDLSDMTEAYIERQYASGKISLEDGRRYLGLLRRGPSIAK
jgi:hypothetical protein